MKIMANKKLIILLSLGFILMFSVTASAHRVVVYAAVEGEELIVKGVYGDGDPVQKAEVEVYGPAGKLLVSGKTDTDGKYSCPLPAREDLRVVLTAGLGHQAEYILSKDEIPEINNQTGSTNLQGIQEDELRSIISEELDRKLKPLQNTLVDIQLASSRPGMTEILGGIGYIFGLLALYLYFREKRRNKNDDR